MPAIIAWIIGGFVASAGTLVGRVLISLGLGYAVYSGIDTSLTFLKNQFVSGMGGLPVMALQLAGMLKLGPCVSILLSALTVRLVIQSMTGGSIKRMVQK